MGLKVVGISFHVGSGARNPAAFPIAVKMARDAFDKAIAVGHEMTVRGAGCSTAPRVFYCPGG